MAPPTVVGGRPASARPQPQAPAYAAPAPRAPLPVASRQGAAAPARAAPANPQTIPAQTNPLLNPDGTINPEASGGYTGPFLPRRQAKGQGADIVTIILVILAFLAVAGLVPLYLLGVFPLL